MDRTTHCGAETTGSSVTATEIAERLAQRAEAVCVYLLPAGRRNGDEYEIGDVRGTPGKSLRINLNGKAGVWSDFATGEKGDLLDLWRVTRGLDTSSAMAEAADWLGEPAQPRSNGDGIPADAPAGHPKWKIKPTGRWCYTNAAGEPGLIPYRYDKGDGTKVFFVYDLAAGKWCKNGEHALPDPRPLYRLHVLAQRPAGEVVLVEGEKCADALARLGIIVTTTLGGAGQIHKADFAPLAGWRVLIWPDADDAGQKYAATAAAMLRAVGAEPLLVPVPPDVPEAWDVADAVRDGWTVDEIRAQLGMAESQTTPPSSGAGPLKALRRLSTVEVTEPIYVWRPYLQRDAVNLLVGEYDTGKTWVACMIAAAQTKGWHLPDGRTGEIPDGVVEPGAVLYFTAENDPSTIRFRVDRLGGDPDRITFWDTAEAPLPKLADIHVLEAALAEVRPRLVIFDPIQSGLDHRRNMDKANEVRPMLDALAALARRHNCAILALAHLNKATGQQAKHRIIGSVDFGAAPRSILIAAAHRDAGPEHRVLYHLKNSVGRKGASLSYKLDGEDQGVEFTWGGGIEVDIDTLLSPPRNDRTETTSGKAMQWLRDFLRGGAKSYDSIVTEGGKVGFSESTLKYAGKALAVRKLSFGFPRTTTWELVGGTV